MTENPILNALAAALYIVAVSAAMFTVARYGGHQFTILIPMAIISLFTLSAAVMGYIFLYRPLQLFLDGDRRRAVGLFLTTVAIFAGITVLVFVSAFFGASVFN